MILKHRYEKHITEKDSVREIKKAIKLRVKSSNNLIAANFDLEQVLYLPKSLRIDLFYKDTKYADVAFLRWMCRAK